MHSLSPLTEYTVVVQFTSNVHTKIVRPPLILSTPKGHDKFVCPHLTYTAKVVRLPLKYNTEVVHPPLKYKLWLSVPSKVYIKVVSVL